MQTIDITEAVTEVIANGYATADDLRFNGGYGVIVPKDGQWVTFHPATAQRMATLAATGDREAAEEAAKAHYSPRPKHGSCHYCGLDLDRTGECVECGGGL